MTESKDTTNNRSKATKISDFFRNIIIPILSVVFGAGMIWAGLKNKVDNNAYAISDLEVRCEQVEDDQNEIKQELSGINAKLEYIIKEIDKLDN